MSCSKPLKIQAIDYQYFKKMNYLHFNIGIAFELYKEAKVP